MKQIALLGSTGSIGRQTIDVVEQHPEKYEIIALTANTLDNDKDKCINAGMNDYLAKPFSAQDLYRVIDNVLNHD